MVKNGEVYNKFSGEDVNSLPERPRNIFNPSDEGCGLLAYVQ